MHRGYVKLWRKSLDSGLLQNAEAWQLMTWCLLKAAHKPHKQIVGKQIVQLDKGQLVFGRKKAAGELGTTERKVRSCLSLLEKFGFLTTKTTNKYSIITVVNWATYQSEETINDQQSANKRPSADQQTTTNKNEKNEEESLLSSGNQTDASDAPEKTKAPPVPYNAIIDLYHEVLPELPQVRMVNQKRKTAIKARWLHSSKSQDLGYWKRFFGYVKESAFLMGERTNFKANLDFLFTESKFIKIIEGVYHE